MSQRTFDPARCIENLFRGNAKPINRLFPFLRFPPTSGAFRRIVGATRRLIIAPIISSVSVAVHARENGETPATFPAADPAAVLQGRRFIDRESVSAAEWRKMPIQERGFLGSPRDRARRGAAAIATPSGHSKIPRRPASGECAVLVEGAKERSFDRNPVSRPARTKRTRLRHGRS